MRPGSVLLLLATTALAGCLADETEPEPLQAFDFIGDGCEEAVALFQMPVAQARDHVPEGYALLGAETGQATAFVSMIECEALAVAGGNTTEARFGEVGFMLQPPAERAGTFEYYLLWVVSDHAPLAEAYEAMGVRTMRAGTSYTGYGILGTYTASAQVAPEGGSYKIEVTGQVESTSGGMASMAWHETPHGTWRQANTFAMTEQGAGKATIVSSEGTSLRSLTGGRSVDGAGLINAFSGSFQATLV